MPPLQGEVSLLTLFADIHYYFSPPSSSPPHHRFDKGSYVYLYHNPLHQRGRVEIANHAGTPHQDAFAGNLDTVKIEQTYKHPCLFTITIDTFRSKGGSAASSPQQDMSQWHLPAHDPRNEGKYMYRLHTVDIYFWTPDDATMFLDSLRRFTQPHQLAIVANPTPAHSEHKSDMLNPVVAKLEKAAISHSSRSPSISTTQSFPGPPTAPAPTSSPPVADASVNYTPMAYNPAAPAAPEPVAHREKTPPPPDAADGTGLGTAAMNDQHASQYGNPLQSSFAPQSTAGQPYIPGPPSRTQTFSGPPTPGIQRTNTTGSLPPPPPQSPPQAQQYPQSFAPPPTAPPPSQYDQNGPPQPGIQRHSTMPVPQYANYPHSPGYPPVQSPGVPGTAGHPMPSPGYAPQPYQPLASPGHPPPGGYTQYKYGSTTQQAPGTDPYNPMHQQLYKPTEDEASVAAHGGEPPQGQRNSNIGKRAEKVEKGVGRFLKKLDKKF
ncbi:uncharacterized protein BDR25DRAFT_277547 [Lindgomyces ingoldianus]|uniref:Uncharacterized protein n=1 Tax=Lindgomyces ingoldianus TaxID=673940 RepID=A0ACB6RDM8_9PLEO|nr:uncharacterized protein BDR25DRAFT_277547 [Lindgomyces ingoldianus]KAF2476437.1 hypothetical protein BDR25DRAFT_277547 [Lindgomyces ingoldianus]